MAHFPQVKSSTIHLAVESSKYFCLVLRQFFLFMIITLQLKRKVKMEYLFQETFFHQLLFSKGCVVEEGVDYRAGGAKVITQKPQTIND